MLTAWNRSRGTVIAERLEVAGTFRAKLLGLMGRTNLPPGHGLWLPGSNGIHMLFMRMPIDAVFVSRATADGSRIVIALRAGLRPWTGIVPLVRGADGVLELPPGAIIQSGTQRGDRVEIAASG